MNDTKAVATFQEPRLPYHNAISERFGIDKTTWKVLTEAVFPGAKTVDSIVLALSYCKSRKLDPLKRVVHIVPVWDSNRKAMVETVWPGIADHRITAFRTGQYAGKAETKYGPDKTRQFGGKEITYPEWAQVTVYRRIGGENVAFAGPTVWWEETYAGNKEGVPNDRWSRAPRGQLEKCAEAASLRSAFPEEMGGEITAEEMEGQQMHDITPQAETTEAPKKPRGRPATAKLQELEQQVNTETGEVTEEPATVAPNEYENDFLGE